jgi:hypothetical protein
MEHGKEILDLELVDRIDLHGPIAACVCVCVFWQLALAALGHHS